MDRFTGGMQVRDVTAGRLVRVPAQCRLELGGKQDLLMHYTLPVKPIAAR